jgi:hypothetical protein
LSATVIRADVGVLGVPNNIVRLIQQVRSAKIASLPGEKRRKVDGHAGIAISAAAVGCIDRNSRPVLQRPTATLYGVSYDGGFAEARR